MNTQTNIQKRHVDVVTKYFYPIAGGIENNIMQTYVTLQDTFGWDVTIHTSRDTYTEKNILVPEEIINGIRVKRYESGLFGFSSNINWKTTDVVALHNFDIFFMRYLFHSLLLKIAGKKQFTLILTPHGGFSPEWSMFTPVSRFIKKIYTYSLGTLLINAVVDGVRAVSEWERSEEVKYIISSKVHLIDNGLEDEAYEDVNMLSSDNVKSAVASYGKYIIQVARIYPIKNIETTIQALKYLPEDIKFVVVGQLQDTAYEQKLKKLIADLKLEKRVIFTGTIRGVDKYYLMRNAIAMVHMALWESGCNVVREGMSQGLPCIVSNVYGLPGLIKNGVNGFCLPVRDYNKVAEKVLWIIDKQNTVNVQKISEANIIFGKGQSWKEVARKMDMLYRSAKTKVRIPFAVFLMLRNTTYSIIGLFNSIFSNRTPHIIIYCYHSISDDGWRFSVTENNFKKQIHCLLKNQIPLSVQDLPSYLSGEKKLTKNAFVITFDDGYADIISIKDFLKELNVYPTVFILSNSEHAHRDELETERAFLSEEQIRDLQSSGWEIGSHSATHANFAFLSAIQIDKEVNESKIELEKKIGHPVAYFAYPKGVYSPQILNAVSAAHYTLAFSVDDDYVTTQTNTLAIPRVGVDGTHTLQQFLHLASPLAMSVRKIVKKIL